MSVTCPKEFEMTVYGNTTPCDLSTPDNTVLSEQFITDVTVLNSTKSYGADLQPMNYDLEDVGGCYTYETVVGGGCGATSDTLTKAGHEIISTPAFGVPLSTQLTQTGSDQPEFLPMAGCPANPNYDCVNIVGDTVLNTFHPGGDLSLKYTGWGGYALTTRHNRAPNPTWRLRRIARPIVAVPARLRVAAASLATLTPVLVPLPGAGPGGALPAFNGTFPNRDIFILASDWTWRGDGSQLFSSALSDNELYHTTFEPLSTTGCAWICGFGYSSGGSWAGIGGGGGISGGGPYPYGRFFFNTGLFSFAVDGQYADVRVATTAALPANTRVANVLTADVVGAFPAIDGISLAVGNRILVKNEAAGLKNGVYTVTSLGSAATFWSLTRATDMDTSPEVFQGIFVEVIEGTTLEGTYWRLVTLDPITLNTTSMSWLQIPSYIDVESY